MDLLLLLVVSSQLSQHWIESSVIADVILRDHLRYKYSSLERPVYVTRCAAAIGGCPSRVKKLVWLVYVKALIKGVDPLLAVSVALSESHFNPEARGSQGEIGIFQIHPSRMEAPKLLRYIAENDCKTEDWECQAPVVDIALGILHRSLKRCDTVYQALGMYNAGSCKETPYSFKVMKVYGKLHDRSSHSQ